MVFKVTQKTFTLVDTKGRYEFAGSLDYDSEFKAWNIHVGLDQFDFTSEKEALMALAETAMRLHDALTQAVKEIQHEEHSKL